ncbi:MAG: hypothetical protein HY438_01760 [DPANN group archaeon]|nr:hypothetical protein [DPANN group archaeon]
MENPRSISIWLAAFLVLVLGLNLIFFTNGLNPTMKASLLAVTGFTTASGPCQNVVGGVECLGVRYDLEIVHGACPSGTKRVCTNYCEIEKAMIRDNRVCPTYCNDYCLTPDLTALVGK